MILQRRVRYSLKMHSLKKNKDVFPQSLHWDHHLQPWHAEFGSFMFSILFKNVILPIFLLFTLRKPHKEHLVTKVIIMEKKPLIVLLKELFQRADSFMNSTSHESMLRLSIIPLASSVGFFCVFYFIKIVLHPISNVSFMQVEKTT